MIKYWLMVTILLLFPPGLLAEVITDGSLGQRVELPGPNYKIEVELGQLQGGNLFHSFQDFNLSFGQEAVFLGPDNVQNILSRVTGGNPSVVDGTIQSQSPADLYFFNPNGIVFGANAKLDIQGSFHASTAHYLSLDDGEKFSTQLSQESGLSAASPIAFGFLNAPIGNISVGGEEANKSTGLSVPSTKTLSLIGGNLTVKNGYFLKEPEPHHCGTLKYDQPILSAPSGQINLIGVGSVGEVKLKDALPDRFVDVSSFSSNLANVQIQDASVQTNAEGEKNAIGINVRAENLVLDDGRLVSETNSTANGGNIDIEVTESVTLSGERYTELLETGAPPDSGIPAFVPKDPTSTIETLISTRTYSTRTYDTGQGGDVRISSKELYVHAARHISTPTFLDGQGGNIYLKLTDKLEITGSPPNEYLSPGAIESQAGPGSTGKAGHIEIEMKDGQILLDNRANISAMTFGAGDSGNVLIEGVRNLELNNKSQIQAVTLGAGKGGNLKINASHINLNGESSSGNIEDDRTGFFVSSNPCGLFGPDCGNNPPSNDAGDLEVNAEQINMVNTTGISAGTYGPGKGGQITVNASQLNLDNSIIRAESDYPWLKSDYPDLPEYAGTLGDAGNIFLNLKQLQMKKSFIKATTERGAAGGNITAIYARLYDLVDSEISTSVLADLGDGGNITLNPELLVLQNSKVLAKAHEGRGGNIGIGNLIQTPDSKIDASSKLGMDGEIFISREMDGTVLLSGLPSEPSPLDLSTSRCSNFLDESNFIITSRDVPAESPIDLKIHPLFSN